MTRRDDELLPLSGLQHFAFCRRQWALIHIERLWAENVRTVEGDLMHARAHNEALRERRGNTLTVRGLPVFSHTLGISGKCDVMEFHLDPNGVTLAGESGTWQPFPVEYKRGAPKSHAADELQLCAQAMCLEEMLCCDISCGALYYGETHRRMSVNFTPELRETVRSFCAEMHALFQRGYTPKVRPQKGCTACSLKELCLPGLQKQGSAANYIRRAREESE